MSVKTVIRMSNPLKGKTVYWALQFPDGKLHMRDEMDIKTEWDPPWCSLVLFTRKATAVKVTKDYFYLEHCTPVKINISLREALA